MGEICLLGTLNKIKISAQAPDLGNSATFYFLNFLSKCNGYRKVHNTGVSPSSSTVFNRVSAGGSNKKNPTEGISVFKTRVTARARACVVQARQSGRKWEGRKTRPFPGLSAPWALSRRFSPSREFAALLPLLRASAALFVAPARFRPAPRAGSHPGCRPAPSPLFPALAFQVRPAARGLSTMVGTVTSQGGALVGGARACGPVGDGGGGEAVSRL